MPRHLATDTDNPSKQEVLGTLGRTLGSLACLACGIAWVSKGAYLTGPLSLLLGAYLAWTAAQAAVAMHHRTTNTDATDDQS